MKFFQVALVSLGSMALGAAAWAQGAPLVWHWPMSMEATRAAPDNHKILYQDDHVSLLEVTIRPGETEPLHGHMYPSVFAYDAEQPALDNTEENGKVNHVARTYTDPAQFPTCRTMGIQAPHYVHIVDDFPQHFYRLQFKRMDRTDTTGMHYGQTHHGQPQRGQGAHG